MFTKKTVSFLRALKRNNDREWFRERKEDYEQHVRGPMIEVLGRLSTDFNTFAPELIADPKVSLFRIYRDTRFSNDKTPLKTAIAAHFPSRHFARNQGAGLYFEVAPSWVWIGGGMYMPSTSDLQAIRHQIAATHPRLHRLVMAPAFKKTVGGLTGDRLSRVPNGYVKDHPAAHYLQFKQFIGGCEYEAAFATSPRFYSELLHVFKAVTPLVRFLNSAMLESATQPPVLADARPSRDRRRTASPPPVATPMW
ncbi:MAG TPA: DUF2461 domain-containing protein [Vicinamibacterales bacterium]|jgi:uncharacterized protein (TIGR02453 family)|nr:DUF2461 domain-containing protein [Vicinamibacterales bacterium]